MNLLRMFLFLLMSSLFAQDLGWNELLQSAKQDPAVKVASRKVSIYGQGNGSDLWNDLEVGYKADGLDGREHEVELRLEPLGWGETQANSNLWTTQQKQAEARLDQVFNRILANRYRKGLNWLYRKQQKELHQKLVQVYDDRVQVHLSFSATEQFDPQDLVASQQKKLDYQGEVIEDDNNLKELEYSLTRLVPETQKITVDSSNLLSISMLKDRLDYLNFQTDTTYPNIRVAKLKLSIANQKALREKARSRDWVSQIQTSYKWQIPEAGKKDKTTALEDLSLGFRIRIPFRDGRESDILSRQLDLLEEQTSYHEDFEEMEAEIAELRTEIQSLIQQMELHEDFLKQVDTGNLFTDYALRVGSDPLLLLKARESSLLSQLQSLKLRFEIYQRYIEVLKLAGMLSRNPHINLLKGDVE